MRRSILNIERIESQRLGSWVWFMVQDPWLGIRFEVLTHYILYNLLNDRDKNKNFCLTKVANFVLQFRSNGDKPSYPYPNMFWKIFLDLELGSVEDNCSTANCISLRYSVTLRCQPLCTTHTANIIDKSKICLNLEPHLIYITNCRY